MPYTPDVEAVKHNLEPVEGDGVVMRLLGSGSGIVEFKGDFFRKVQEQMRQRIMLIESGVDEATELDKFLLYIFEAAYIRGYKGKL